MKMPPSHPSLSRRHFGLGVLSSALLGCGYVDPAPRSASEVQRSGNGTQKGGASLGFPAWPSGLTPEDSPVFVENEILVRAPLPLVWAWLTRADRWPSWFDRAKNLRFERGGPELSEGSVLLWEMLGSTIRVTVTRVETHSILAWEGGARGVHAYHAWLLTPEAKGTRVRTVETEVGPVPSLVGWAYQDSLHQAHEDWLQSLAKVAAAGAWP